MPASKKIQAAIEKSSFIRKMFEEGAKRKQQFGPENVFDFSLGNPNLEPPLKLKVEYGEGVKEEELQGLADEIGEAMHDRLSVRPKIEWLPPNTLERFTYKSKLVEKAYKKE